MSITLPLQKYPTPCQYFVSKYMQSVGFYSINYVNVIKY